MKTAPGFRKLVGALIGVAMLVVPSTTVLAGSGLDANLASVFARLGLTENDMGNVLDNTLDVSDPTLYRFAGASDPPSIDPVEAAWGVPVRIGVTWAVWPNTGVVPSFPVAPEIVEGALFLPHGGPVAGVEYALMWAQMSGSIPVDPPGDLYQIWSFLFAVPGSSTWQPLPQFPNDTWGGASAIPYISFGPDPYSLSVSVVATDGVLLDQDFNGFGLISGDIIIVGVDADTLFPNGRAGVTYGFAGHVHDGGFGAGEDSASLISYATGAPGTLVAIPPASVLQVGSTAPPRITTTTTPSTSSTIVQSTTTTQTETTAKPSKPASGFPLLPLLLGVLGIVVVVVGGRMYYLNARDPCSEGLLVWQQAKKACDESLSLATKASRDCDRATQRVADLEKLHRDLCTKWPPACEEEGSSTEDLAHPDTRLTSRDLHARRIALGRFWDDHLTGDIDDQVLEEAWRRADTPEFREEMRRKTDQKVAQREKIESDIHKASRRRDELRSDLANAEQAAQILCDKAARAKTTHDRCTEAQNVRSFLDAFFTLRSRPPEEPAPQATLDPADPTHSSDDETVPGNVGVPISFTIDKVGLTGEDLTTAMKLERVFRLRRGTGDLALVAKDLWQFDNWHISRFGEPWFEWSIVGDSDAITNRGSPERFMQSRVMTCYEFVHFCAYIASDQPGTQRTADEVDDVSLSDFSVDWGFADEVSLDTSPSTDQAPSGSVITGSLRWGDYDNSAGFYHAGISIGDGKVISLGCDGLVLEDACGMVDACFPGVAYTDVRYGNYAWGGTNPAPS